MKQVVVILAIMLIVNSGKAEGTQPDIELTFEEHQQIAWALQILEKYNTVTVDDNKCVQLKPSILERLKKEGLLKLGGSKLMSICADAGN